MLRKSLLLISLLLSACGTSNTTDVKNKSKESNIPITDSDTTSTSVSVPTTSTNVPAKELEVTNGSVVYSKKHVIVNAANKWLAPGGVLSGAIFGAAGSDNVLGEIASKHEGVSNKEMSGKPLLETSKVFTTGAYDLAKQGTQYIIHALGPNFSETPYNKSMDKGYADLRMTYQNVFAEMDQLNKKHHVTTLGIIPISAGVFAGGADKTKLFEIMVEETLSAMRTYPAIQPELYLFGKSEYEAVKKVLSTAVSKLTPSSMLSSGVSTSLSKLALLESSIYQAQVCSDDVSGAAVSFGSMRLMGSVVENPIEKKTQLIVGNMNNNSFLGCELETAYRGQEFAYCAIKATGVVQFSDSLKIVGGLGYMRENMATSLSHNMRHFLNLDKKEYEYHSIVGDVIVQHQVSLSSKVSFTSHVGLRALNRGETFVSPFMQTSCNFEELQISASICQQEVGFNFQHHQ